MMKYDIHGPCTRKFKAATPPTRPNSEGRKRVDMLWQPVTQNACENQLIDVIGTLLVVENANPVCDADRYISGRAVDNCSTATQRTAKDDAVCPYRVEGYEVDGQALVVMEGLTGRR